MKLARDIVRRETSTGRPILEARGLAKVFGEPRASAWYKQGLLRTLIGRALRQAGAGR